MMMPIGPRPQPPQQPREIKPLAPELVEQLRQQFRVLIEDENFIGKLATVERLAASTRELALVLGDPAGGMLAMACGASQLPLAQTIAPNPYYANTGDGSVGYGTFTTSPYGTGGPEQFGARAIRELVGLAPEVASRIAKTLKESPTAMVKAIAEARVQGLTDLADKLEHKLLDAIGAAEAEELPHEHAPHHEPAPTPTPGEPTAMLTNGAAS